MTAQANEKYHYKGDWEATDLEGLLEKDFRKQILIPLFRAKGYREVEHTHTHGTTEFGKDIVFWRESNAGKRENVAVVAKRGKVNAQASGDVRTIGTQVRQAFGRSYLEKGSGRREQTVDRVIVAATGKIGHHARAAIQSFIENESYSERLEFLERDEIVEQLNEHCPRRSISERLTEMGDVLANSGELAIKPFFDSNGSVNYWIEPSGEENVDVATGKFVFPDTPKGNRMREETQRFFREGGALTVSGKFVDSFEQHPELAQLFGDTTPDLIHVAQLPGKPIPIRIEVEAEPTPITYENISIRVERSGEQKAEFRTVGDNPLQMSIDLFLDPNNRQKASYQIELSLSIGRQQISKSRKALRVFQSIVEGGSFKVIQKETDSQFLPPQKMGSEATVDAPLEKIASYLEDLAKIEEHFGWDLTLPENTFTDRDILDAQELREAIETGSYSQPFRPFTTRIQLQDDVEFSELFASGKSGYLYLGPFSTCTYEILDRKVDLGPGYSAYHVTMAKDDFEDVVAQHNRGEKVISAKFSEAPDSQGVKYFYRNFLPEAHQKNFDKHYGEILKEEKYADNTCNGLPQ